MIARHIELLSAEVPTQATRKIDTDVRVRADLQIHELAPAKRTDGGRPRRRRRGRSLINAQADNAGRSYWTDGLIEIQHDSRPLRTGHGANRIAREARHGPGQRGAE
jgi:hypothetical protein